MAGHDDIPLGKDTQYAFEYCPEVLFPISREQEREKLGLGERLPFAGVDRWTAYELSWLDKSGKPHVAIAEFDFSSNSPNIVESKSFKLYLNGFNMTKLGSREELISKMENDLSIIAGAPVVVRLFDPDQYPVYDGRDYQLLDDMDIDASDYDVEASLLKKGVGEKTNEKLRTNLFRSLCPVTGQPDWATVFIEYNGEKIDHSSLLRYLVSFRNHQGFHEQCVEKIFTDVYSVYELDELIVYARFMRRGGLDINPFRQTANGNASLPQGFRGARQ